MRHFYDTQGASRRNPVRFAIELINGQRHKVFNYVRADSEGGVALHSYCLLSWGYLKEVEVPLNGVESHPFITQSEYKENAKDFKVQKVTFHPSGVMTFKSKQGERFSEDSPDPRSLAFSEIPEFIKLCHIYSMPYAEYPEANNSKGGICHYIPAPNDNPMRFELHVCKSKFSLKFEKSLMDSMYGFTAFRDRESLVNDDCYLYTVFCPSGYNAFNPGDVSYFPIWQKYGQGK